MSQLIVNGVITVSGRDIADLVGSRRDHVKRSIEHSAERGVIELPPMGKAKNHLNQSVSVYPIGKRDGYIVVAQLSPELTARLVDRWQELEQTRQQTVPQPFSETLRLAADLVEQKQQSTSELAAAAPKVEFVDRYCTASGSMSFRQMAKLFKTKEPDLRLFLLEDGIVYHLDGTMTPWYQHIDAGRFEMETGTFVTSSHTFGRARFTAKGVHWIGGLWTEHIAKGQVV